MKKLTVIAVILFTSFRSFAQVDTGMAEQYAEVVAAPRLLSNKVTIDIDYGVERSIWKDNRLKEENGKLKKFNTTIDALNYMGKEGWKLVNAFPVMAGQNSQVYHYVFKKSFTRSEIAQ